ncbi:TOMM precursor leader peptide-binding protein [Nocardioides alcanivorans]|uniref:TOMM precursor leader peptide-binding protein n=1 Tax=Nocardioides alcanivorans TaxID=2897352 RepID=UPI001F1A8028|nr:TOMM precursor leader peptide-binding protein [Nocardioides alcanivorans]
MHIGAHPMLRPGVVVCRRGDGTLQIGLQPEGAVHARDMPDVRALLAGLRDGAPAPDLASLDPRVARCYLDLVEHHLVIDGDDYVAGLGRSTDAAAREFLTADVAELGGVARRRNRAAITIGVEDTGLPAAGDRLLSLVQAAGFSVLRRPLAAEASAEFPTVDAVLLIDANVTDRAVVDRLVADGVPHLPLSCAEGRVLLGPFVAPGRSSCLRCVDAALAEHDPRRALVIEQYARHRSAWPAAVPHDLLQVALGWAVRDLTRWVTGERPTTWSTVLEMDPALTLPRHSFPPHVECGCSWDRLYAQFG